MKTKQDLINLGLSEAKADEIMLLEERMLDRAVAFQYRKKDGTIRNAIGTLCRSLMVLADNTMWEPKGEAKPENPALLTYFDCDAKGWRSCQVVNYLAME